MPLPATIDDRLLGRLTDRVRSSGGATYKLLEVYTGEVITALPQSTPADVEAAYDDARAAQQEWASWPLDKRLAVMKRFHKLLLKNYETVVDLMQAETGKARRMSFEEVCDVAMTTSHYLKTATRVLSDKKRGGVVPFASTATEVRAPKGVIGLISPWNFPFATSLSDAMPALIAGNGVVLKPDNKSTLNVAFGVSLLEEAGLPAGLVQIVCGEGPDVGPAIVDGADYVMFTGSTATGRFIGERAGANLIGCTLELGGKNPLVVMPDADLDEVVPGALFGSFLNAGQACMHIERIYVHASIAEEFTRRFVIGAEKIALGASYDWEPEMGSLISVDHLERVSDHVEDARAAGRRGAHRRAGPPRPGADVLRADGAARGHAGDEAREGGDLRPGHHDLHLRDRGRGRGAGQRHRLRPQRQHLVDATSTAAEAARAADPGGQHRHQRQPRLRLRQQVDAVGRHQELRRRLAARRLRAAEVHRPDQRRGPQEAGPHPAGRRRLRQVRQADRPLAQGHAPARAAVTVSLGTW